MRKISYYLIFIVIAGSALIAFWVYQKYFEEEGPAPLFFTVERGGIREVIKVRGQVVAQKDFDLEFSFSGIVEEVFVKEGQEVYQGKPLVKLETTDFELERAQLEALLAQKRANLDKLIAGPTGEDINVAEVKVANAETALEDAKKNFIDRLYDAFTKADDAIRNKVDQFISSPRSSSPQLNLPSGSDAQLESDIEWQRLLLENKLSAWKLSVAALTTFSDFSSFLEEAKTNLDDVRGFLDKVSLLLSITSAGATLSQTTLDGYRTDVSTARTNVNTAIVNLTAAEEKLRTAESNLALAQKELSFKRAGTRSEDIEIAEAQVEETKSQIAATEEKIRKSTLYAPAAAKIVKVWFEEQELFRPGQAVISLSTSGHKIRADVSELEIGKIREVDSNDVLIKLDAFPGQEFKGRVVSVEPREIVKEGDKYYRVNVYLERHEEKVRSGMSADLDILISSKENILKIPELATYQKDGKKFVKVLEDKATVTRQVRYKEVEIETGISDGEAIEIIKGLSEGQIIAVFAD